jgi:hypothetical protein
MHMVCWISGSVDRDNRIPRRRRPAARRIGRRRNGLDKREDGMSFYLLIGLCGKVAPFWIVYDFMNGGFSAICHAGAGFSCR